MFLIRLYKIGISSNGHHTCAQIYQFCRSDELPYRIAFLYDSGSNLPNGATGNHYSLLVVDFDSYDRKNLAL